MALVRPMKSPDLPLSPSWDPRFTRMRSDARGKNAANQKMFLLFSSPFYATPGGAP
ncbi:MAG: hypothetical protein CM15mP103_02660 [Gammaproteobacteria bacterium]|nr:MAG: hypothetical protein CM15mP103_02660 [Gammaproteobacteria bacterium]